MENVKSIIWSHENDFKDILNDNLSELSDSYISSL